MGELGILILDDNYSNINDYELIEAEFVLQDNQARLKPKIKGYYKSHFLEISNLLLASAQKPDELLNDIQEQASLFKINNFETKDDLKIIIYDLPKDSLRYYCLFKISRLV